MELVTIQEASLRLRMSRSSLRKCIRNGELKAYRQPGPNARPVWVVELPEEGWTSAATEQELTRGFFPWWWADEQRAGSVHYIQELYISAFEEISPQFLCGLKSDNIWTAYDLSEDQLCAQCLSEAQSRDLPTTLQPQQ